MIKLNKKRMERLFSQLRSENITLGELDRAEQKASFLEERAEDFKLLVSMCRDSINGKYKINEWSISILIGTILYVVSPLDAIPDIVPILGWLDDATIVGYALSRLSQEILKYKSFKSKEIDQS